MKIRTAIILTIISVLLFSCSSRNELPDTGDQPTTAAGEPTNLSPATQPLPDLPAQATASALAAAPTLSAAPDGASSTQETPKPANCTAPADLTPALTEGPYWKEGSPERTNLIDSGMPGTKITITGYVLDGECQPVPGAWIDFWQADSNGNYDNNGYILRGHQFTDADGRYILETVVPGLYSGRTEHIHVKVQAPGGPELTTQFFFPDVAANLSDRIFEPSLVLSVEERGGEQFAEFNFIVATR